MLVQITTQQTTDKFHLLKKQWAGCKDCRRGVITKNQSHFRGTLPAPILFVGGAPSPSDEREGLPITGRPGEVLDQLFTLSIETAGIAPLPYAVINLVACYDGCTSVWSSEAEACQDRVTQLQRLCQPQLIVLLGIYAADHFRKVVTNCEVIRTHHPETLLDPCGDSQLRLLAAQQFVDTLANALRSLSIRNAQTPSVPVNVDNQLDPNLFPLDRRIDPSLFAYKFGSKETHPANKHPQDVSMERTTGRRNNLLATV